MAQRYLEEVSVTKLRIKFAKRGNMKFIGHLDIMRYFQKAMRRADIDIVYTEGFSPHQKMSFASPLGVGLISEGEYFDIEVSSSKSSKEMIDVLNTVMADGMEVLSVKKLPDHAQNGMSLVAAADYKLEFRDGYTPESTLDMDGLAFEKAFSEFVNRPTIPIVKKTKKGERQLDLKPLIYSAYIKDRSIFLSLSAGSTDNIKPELVMEAFYHTLGKQPPEFTFQITRLEVYADMGDGGERKLVPLDKLGQDIE